MGVDLSGLVPKKETALEDLRGRLLAVDAYNVLYQFLTTIRGADGRPLADRQGRVTSHLAGLLYRTASLLEKGLRLVYVFDGPPHPLKAATLEKRDEARQQAREKMLAAQAAGDQEAYQKFAARAVRLTPETVEEAKKLTDLMGVPRVQAVHDGEAQAAVMAAKGEVYACASQDYDALLYGAPRLVCNVAVTGRRKLPGRQVYVEARPFEVSLRETLHALGIDRKKLVWLALLIGTDYNEKLPGVGPKTALKLVQQHARFEDILAARNATAPFKVEALEALFLHPPAAKDYDLKARAPDPEGLQRFLCDEHDFSPERVARAAEKLRQRFEDKATQARLDAWQ